MNIKCINNNVPGSIDGTKWKYLTKGKIYVYQRYNAVDDTITVLNDEGKLYDFPSSNFDSTSVIRDNRLNRLGI